MTVKGSNSQLIVDAATPAAMLVLTKSLRFMRMFLIL